MAVVYDGQYQYARAGIIDRTYQRVAGELKRAPFGSIARSFAFSLDRLSYLHDLQIQLIYWSQVIVRCDMLAHHQLGLHPDDYSQDGTDALRRLCIVRRETA